MPSQFDLDRIERAAREGLAQVDVEVEESGHTNLSVETFAIAAIVSYDDEDGDEREECVIFSESKRIYVKEGIFTAALERLASLRE